MFMPEPAQVRMHEVCAAQKPDAKEIQLLLESALTVTLQVHVMGAGKNTALTVASMKVSEDLRKLKLLTDSFPVFVKKRLGIKIVWLLTACLPYFLYQCRRGIVNEQQ